MNNKEKAKIINTLIEEAGLSNIYSAKASIRTVIFFQTTQEGKNKGNKYQLSDKKRQMPLLNKLGFSTHKQFNNKVLEIHKQNTKNANKTHQKNATNNAEKSTEKTQKNAPKTLSEKQYKDKKERFDKGGELSQTNDKVVRTYKKIESIKLLWAEFGKGEYNKEFKTLPELQQFYYQNIPKIEVPKTNHGYIKSRIEIVLSDDKGNTFTASPRIDISKTPGDFDLYNDNIISYLLELYKFPVETNENHDLVKVDFSDVFALHNVADYNHKNIGKSTENKQANEKTDKTESLILKKYKSLKERYPNSILLFKVGKYYEIFYSDAEEAADILGITKTKRLIENKEYMALAGFPVFDLSKNVTKLTNKGKSVVIIDEDFAAFEDSKIGKDLMSKMSKISGKQNNNQPPKTDYKNQYELNKAIEKFIKSKKGNYTQEEKDFIAKFEGYGGLFDEANDKGEDYKAKFRVEYFTPPAICKTMIKLAIKHGYKEYASVLEPSAGTGNFLKYFSPKTPITTYEINPVQHQIMKILYPNATHHNKAFEYMFLTGPKKRTSLKGKVKDLPKFDLVIGNPPYGKYNNAEAGYGEKTYTKADNYIDYFISRGLDVTRQGGLLIFVIGAEPATGGTLFTDKGMTAAKKLIEQKADLIDAYKLWQGAFSRTNVMSEILVFRKK